MANNMPVPTSLPDGGQRGLHVLLADGAEQPIVFAAVEAEPEWVAPVSPSYFFSRWVDWKPFLFQHRAYMTHPADVLQIRRQPITDIYHGRHHAGLRQRLPHRHLRGRRHQRLPGSLSCL